MGNRNSRSQRLPVSVTSSNETVSGSSDSSNEFFLFPAEGLLDEIPLEIIWHVAVFLPLRSLIHFLSSTRRFSVLLSADSDSFWHDVALSQARRMHWNVRLMRPIAEGRHVASSPVSSETLVVEETEDRGEDGGAVSDAMGGCWKIAIREMERKNPVRVVDSKRGFLKKTRPLLSESPFGALSRTKMDGSADDDFLWFFRIDGTVDLSKEDYWGMLTEDVRECSRLRHPNLLRIHACVHGPDPGFVTDYAANSYLKMFVRAFRGRVSRSEKIRMVNEMALVMGYLHDCSFPYGFLTDQSVWLTQARRVRLIPPLRRLSRHFEMGRRQCYSSPELFHVPNEPTNSNDVYAFGFLMFVIAAENTDPFGSSHSVGAIQRAATDPSFRPSLETIEEAVPAWYVRLCGMCWTAEPGKRPTFDEILMTMENSKEDDGEEGE